MDNVRPMRPPKKSADRHGITISVKVTEAERRFLNAEARRQGVSRTDLLLRPVRKAMQEQKGG